MDLEAEAQLPPLRKCVLRSGSLSMCTLKLVVVLNMAGITPGCWLFLRRMDIPTTDFRWKTVGDLVEDVYNMRQARVNKSIQVYKFFLPALDSQMYNRLRCPDSAFLQVVS